MTAPFKTVRDVFQDPMRWTQGSDARDRDGSETSAYDSSATCWCLMGALRLVYPDWDDRMEASRKLAHSGLLDHPGFPFPDPRYEGQMIDWNDNPERKHQEVLDLVTKAGV